MYMDATHRLAGFNTRSGLPLLLTSNAKTRIARLPKSFTHSPFPDLIDSKHNSIHHHLIPNDIPQKASILIIPSIPHPFPILPRSNVSEWSSIIVSHERSVPMRLSFLIDFTRILSLNASTGVFDFVYCVMVAVYGFGDGNRSCSFFFEGGGVLQFHGH